MNKTPHHRILSSSIKSISDIRWDKKYHYKFYSEISLKSKSDIKSISKEAKHIKKCNKLDLRVKKAPLKTFISTLDKIKNFSKSILSLSAEDFSEPTHKFYLKKLLYSSIKSFNFSIVEAAWIWFLLIGRGSKVINVNFPRSNPARTYPLFIKLITVFNSFSESGPVRFNALSESGTFILSKLKDMLPNLNRKMHFEFESFPRDESKIQDYAFLGDSCDLLVRTPYADEALLQASNSSQIKEIKYIVAEPIKEDSISIKSLHKFDSLRSCILDLKTMNMKELLLQFRLPKSLKNLTIRIEDMGKECDEQIPKYEEIVAKPDSIYQAIDCIQKEHAYSKFLGELETLSKLEDFAFGVSYEIERQVPDILLMYAVCKKLKKVKILLLENNLTSDEEDENIMSFNMGVLSNSLPYPEDIKSLHIGIEKLSFVGYHGFKYTSLRKLQLTTKLQPTNQNYIAYSNFVEDLSHSNIKSLTNMPYLGDFDLKAWKDGKFKALEFLFLMGDDHKKLRAEDVAALPEILKYKKKLRTFFFTVDKLVIDKSKVNALRKGLGLANYLDSYEIYFDDKQLVYKR